MVVVVGGGVCWDVVCPLSPPTSSQVSWCKLEVELPTPKQLLTTTPTGTLPTDPPPLVLAALSLKTILTGGTKATNEIVAASVVHQVCDLNSATQLEAWRGGQGVRHFSVVRRLEGQTWPIGACGGCVGGVGGWLGGVLVFLKGAHVLICIPIHQYT